MLIVPSNRPMQPREVTAELLLAKGVHDAVCLVGQRGYYLKTFDSKENERNVYDDAIFLTSPSCHMAFNANVDPSPFQQGVASLNPGIWRFSQNIHGKSKPLDEQYACLEQCEPVTVSRDGGVVETGMFAIQIHRGGYNSTSSLGCQTIYPDQWKSFMPLVKDLLYRYQQPTIPYLLVEGQG